MTIQIRGDTAANWTAANPTLAARQMGYETDTGKIKIGDGSTAWTSLAYRFTGGGVSDGDKGDITVSGSGATWTIDNGVVTLAKQADMATASLVYRKTAGTGAPEVNTLATLKTDLGLTGTNSGDQTSIVGITGTKAEFDAAVTDGNFLYVGDVTSNATHTGDVTGATALTIDPTAITGKTTVTAVGTDYVLISDTSDGGALKKALASDLAGGGGVSDGDKGDITVSSSGTVWTIDAGAVSLSKMADVATSTLFYRTTAGTGAPEVNTLATLKTDLGLTGTNSGDAPPGGATGEVQYNNAGAFAGAADVEIEGGQLRLPYISTPTTPAASGIKLYGMDVLSGMLAYKNPDGYVHMIQPSLMGFNTRRFTPAPNSNSLVLETSMTLSAIGTASAAVPAVTNLHTMSVRTAFLVTVASTSAIAGWRATAGGSRFIRVGSDANAPGGFVYGCLWGPATGVSNTTHRAFVGVSDWSAAPTDVEPSSRANVVGMGWDAADTNIQFMHNDGGGTCTKVDLGASFPVPTADTTGVYELQLYSPNSTTRSVNYRVIRYDTTGKTIAAETSGTVTTNMPPVTTLLCAAGAMSVGGTSSVVGLSNMGTLIATEY